MFSVCIAGILGLFINNALVSPIGQVIFRCGPAYIVVLAVNIAVKAVVASVDIQSPIENPGLPVGNVFITGKIGIKYLFFHFLFFLLRNHILPYYHSTGVSAGKAVEIHNIFQQFLSNKSQKKLLKYFVPVSLLYCWITLG